MFIVIFVCDMLIPVAALICGLLMWLKTPAYNTLGYSTEQSLKSKEAWAWANRYFGLLLARAGLLMTIAAALIHPVFANASSGALMWVMMISITIESVILAAGILITEASIAREFDENGVKRVQPPAK